jgi:hypothetical protein
MEITPLNKLIESIFDETFNRAEAHDPEGTEEFFQCQMLELKALECAIQQQRNEILQKALLAGNSITPEPLEMIAIELGATAKTNPFE